MIHTNQTFFDAVWERARDRRVSLNKATNKCRYRMANGLKCFVGACIPDEDYSPDMEGEPVERLARAGGGMPASIAGVHVLLMRSCQRIHDKHNSSEWEDLLRQVAASYRLVVPK